MSLDISVGNGKTIIDFAKAFGIENPETIKGFRFECYIGSPAEINVERFVDKSKVGLKTLEEKYNIYTEKIEEFKTK